MSDAEQQQAGAAAEEEEDLDALWGNDAPPTRNVQLVQGFTSSDDSSEEESDLESDDTATRRRKEAEARLRDYGEGEAEGNGTTSGPAAGLLPSAAAAFTDVDGPPSFLDPEATRPLAVGSHTGIDRVGTGAAAADAEQDKQPAVGKRGASKDFDISRMAPKLHDSSKPAEPGVISAGAVMYKPDEADGAVTAAQIAMLGGQWGRSTGGGGGEEGAEGGGAPGAEKPPKGKATKPMGVDEFLEKGVGGALLPRKRQDRKDKEKEKRMRGQSTHANWKSEAEMLLRQQYD